MKLHDIINDSIGSKAPISDKTKFFILACRLFQPFFQAYVLFWNLLGLIAISVYDSMINLDVP